MISPESATTVLQRTLRRLGQGGWTPNLVVTAAALLLGPAIGMAMHSAKWAIYGGAVGITIVVWVVAYHMAQAIGAGSNDPGTPTSASGPNVASIGVVNGPVTINQGVTTQPPLSPPLTAEQERLLQILVGLQRQHATSKLVIDRHGQTVRVGDEAGASPEPGFLDRLYGSSSPERGLEFERLMEGMPPEYVRVFSESHWDNPFVVGATARGIEYLTSRGLTSSLQTPSSTVSPIDAADPDAEIRIRTAGNPKAALALVSPEIERHLRPFMAATGFHNKVKPGATLPEDLDLISGTWPLTDSFRQSARRFWDARETVIRGYDIADDDVSRAVDSGLLILKTLQSLRRERKVVSAVGVELYSDKGGRIRRDGVWGIILENTSSDGTETKSFQIFPTTRTDYRLGEEVTWDWNTSRVYDETWYRDPRSGQLSHAWQQAAEFSGRPLKDVNRRN